MFDRDTSRSVPMQLREFISLSTDAAGQATLQVIPRLAGYRRTAATYAGATVATWNGVVDVPDYTNITNLYERFRIVSMGVRVYPIVAPLSASGIVVYQTDLDVNNSPNLTSELYLDTARESLHDAHGVWFMKRIHSTSEYVALTETTPQAPALNLSVYAGPASLPALGVEIVLNLELLPHSLGGGANLSTSAYPHVPLIEGAAGTVAGGLKSVFLGGAEAFRREVIRRAAIAAANLGRGAATALLSGRGAGLPGSVGGLRLTS